mmetsp:Transcript_91212/g.246566  ORF Transcript_91212/g.246566 Transcript_91212/m.246566 type:complete len:272 (+) Transcript_91212:73-888(+)
MGKNGGAASDYGDAGMASSFAKFVGTRAGEVGGTPQHFETNSLNTGMEKLGLRGFEGLRVLDAGCGEGRLCREFAAAGAAQVVGCDSSEAMIETAQNTQLSKPHSATYLLLDVSGSETNSCLTEGGFDLGISMYALQMAKDRTELQGMCNFLSRYCERCLVFTVSGTYEPRERQSELMLKEYGFQSLRESGTTDRLRFVMGESISVLNYQHSDQSCLECLQEAGFKETGMFDFSGTELFHQQMQEFGTDDAQELLKLYSANPHAKCFWAKK